MYSEKATKFCKISTVDLYYVLPVKSTVEISQNFVAFSEYIKFKQESLLTESQWRFSGEIITNTPTQDLSNERQSCVTSIHYVDQSGRNKKGQNIF